MIDENGRCAECGCIPRPDIARALKEEHCHCDAEFNEIYEAFQRMLRQNTQNIEKLAKRLNHDQT